MPIRLTCLLLVASCAMAKGQPVRYKSAFVDPQGRLHVVQTNGLESLRPRSRGQAAFDAPAVSADAETVGWLEAFHDGSPQTWRLVDVKLDLFQNGRMTHRFRTEATYYDWQFWKAGAEVVYATGGEHGGATECERRNVRSGKLLERWSIEEHTPAPEWARRFGEIMRDVR